MNVKEIKDAIRESSPKTVEDKIQQFEREQGPAGWEATRSRFNRASQKDQRLIMLSVQQQLDLTDMEMAGAYGVLEAKGWDIAKLLGETGVEKKVKAWMRTLGPELFRQTRETYNAADAKQKRLIRAEMQDAMEIGPGEWPEVERVLSRYQWSFNHSGDEAARTPPLPPKALAVEAAVWEAVVGKVRAFLTKLGPKEAIARRGAFNAAYGESVSELAQQMWRDIGVASDEVWMARRVLSRYQWDFHDLDEYQLMQGLVEETQELARRLS